MYWWKIIDSYKYLFWWQSESQKRYLTNGVGNKVGFFFIVKFLCMFNKSVICVDHPFIVNQFGVKKGDWLFLGIGAKLEMSIKAVLPQEIFRCPTRCHNLVLSLTSIAHQPLKLMLWGSGAIQVAVYNQSFRETHNVFHTENSFFYSSSSIYSWG